MFSPASWQEHSERNLAEAGKQLKKALQFKSTVDGILAHVATHLRSQKDLTDRALDRRVFEVKRAKALLEEQLAETVVKIGEMDEAVIGLEKAIAAKQGPLATCQLKIQQRKQRPNVELVLDDVDLQLQNECQVRILILLQSIRILKLYLISRTLLTGSTGWRCSSPRAGIASPPCRSPSWSWRPRSRSRPPVSTSTRSSASPPGPATGFTPTDMAKNQTSTKTVPVPKIASCDILELHAVNFVLLACEIIF